MKVGIIGSCVTRDALEFPRKADIELGAYFARSSLASACSDRPVPHVETSSIESAFQRRIVRHDLDKDFLRYVETADFDVLVYDAIDERFSLLTADGAVATRSNEFLRASFDANIFDVVPSGTDQFFDLWQRGWSRLIKALDARGMRSVLRVNQVYWATKALGGVDLGAVATGRSIREANSFLDRLYDRMRQDLPTSQFYVYPEEVLVAADVHKWGVSPFHFVPEFYEAFIRQLERESSIQHAARPAQAWLKRCADAPPAGDVDLLVGQDDVECQDRVFNFKGRHIVHSVHARPDSKRLVFVFSGVDSTPGATRMSYFGLGRSIDATVVHVKDGFGTHGCYLLSVAGDEQVRNAVLSLIRSLQAEFAVGNARTFFIGTSKGASTAIAYGLMAGGGHVIAGEPQIRLGDFIFGLPAVKEVAEWQRSLAYTMMGRFDEGDGGRLNKVITDIAARYGSRFQGSIEILVGETGYYDKHIEPLLTELTNCERVNHVTVARYEFHEHNSVVPFFVDRVREVFGHPPQLG